MSLFLLVLYFISLPINLAKTFIVPSAYVNGLLVDYLAPKIYISQIILVFLIFVLSKAKKKIALSFNVENVFITFGLYIYLGLSVFSVFVATNKVSAAYSIFVLVLNLVSLIILSYYFRNDRERIFKILTNTLSYVVVFLSILGIAQFFLQSSVFNNYLLFGEIPYTYSTYGIAKENLFGITKIPAYSTFPHPNVFGAFLAIVLIWIFYVRKFAVFILGCIALLLTFSVGSIFTLLFGVIALEAIRNFGKKAVILSLLAVTTLSASGFVFPYFSKILDFKTLIVRESLQGSALQVIENSYLTGIGVNNFLMYVDSYHRVPDLIRFTQPVHNIFLLLFAEIGIFGLIGFIFFVIGLLLLLLKQSFGVPAVLFISILQFIILGSFDHHVLTIIQTNLLFWLTASLALSYTYTND